VTGVEVALGVSGVLVSTGVTMVGAGYWFDPLVGATTGGLACAVWVVNVEILIPLVAVLPGTGNPSLVSVLSGPWEAGSLQEARPDTTNPIKMIKTMLLK